MLRNIHTKQGNFPIRDEQTGKYVIVYLLESTNSSFLGSALILVSTNTSLPCSLFTIFLAVLGIYLS